MSSLIFKDILLFYSIMDGYSAWKVFNIFNIPGLYHRIKLNTFLNQESLSLSRVEHQNENFNSASSNIHCQIGKNVMAVCMLFDAKHVGKFQELFYHLFQF